MREVIQHLRCIAEAGVEGYGEAADALDLLDKLRAHPGNTSSASVDEYAEFDRLLLQLVKGGG